VNKTPNPTTPSSEAAQAHWFRNYATPETDVDITIAARSIQLALRPATVVVGGIVKRHVNERITRSLPLLASRLRILPTRFGLAR
jgi:hypothetical protein